MFRYQVKSSIGYVSNTDSREQADIIFEEFYRTVERLGPGNVVSLIDWQESLVISRSS